MAERTPDLRVGLTVLRRRWPVVLAAAVLGLGAGVLYSTLVPVPLRSTALVMLSSGSSSGGDGETSIQTQVRIVQSTPVLARAGSAVTPRLSADDVRDRVEVAAVTDQLIEISAFSPRASQAQALAEAVTNAYVGTVIESAHTVSGAVVKDLEQRRDDLVQQNKDLTAAILAADRDVGLRAKLTLQQGDVLLQLNDVKSELARSGAIPGGSTLASVTQHADPAAAPAPLPRLITSTAAGSLLAAIAAMLAVVARSRRDPRLRARDDMADAVGSSVLADVRSRPQRSVAEWSALFENYTASSVDAWAFRQLLRGLATAAGSDVGARPGARGAGRLEHPPSLTVVTIGGDKRGLALAPQLAAFVASLGLTTRFLVVSGHDAAASLRAACSSERASDLRPGLRLDARSDAPGGDLLPLAAGATPFDDLLAVGSEKPSPEEQKPDDRVHPLVPRHSSPDVTIVLAVMDAKAPTLEGVQPTAVTVLAIAPGVGTREDLARLAVAVDDAGRRIDGLVVADPDPSDRTTGRRTLDERARHVALPLRITGVGNPLPRSERG